MQQRSPGRVLADGRLWLLCLAGIVSRGNPLQLAHAHLLPVTNSGSRCRCSASETDSGLALSVVLVAVAAATYSETSSSIFRGHSLRRLSKRVGGVRSNLITFRWRHGTGIVVHKPPVATHTGVNSGSSAAPAEQTTADLGQHATSRQA